MICTLVRNKFLFITCASEYERIYRHDTIRDAIYDSAKHAGLSPIKEARVNFNSQSRPGDIFLQNWKGRQTAFDVAVTSPLSQTALPQSHKTPGAALASMKSIKLNKHSRPCQVNGVVDGILTLFSTFVRSPSNPLPARH